MIEELGRHGYKVSPGALDPIHPGRGAAAVSPGATPGDDIHPLHRHRHSFELTQIGSADRRVIKDVVMLGGFQEAAFDFVADNPGPTLFHCHHQLHMDFGLMALLRYA